MANRLGRSDLDEELDDSAQPDLHGQVRDWSHGHTFLCLPRDRLFFPHATCRRLRTQKSSLYFLCLHTFGHYTLPCGRKLLSLEALLPVRDGRYLRPRLQPPLVSIVPGGHGIHTAALATSIQRLPVLHQRYLFLAYCPDLLAVSEPKHLLRLFGSTIYDLAHFANNNTIARNTSLAQSIRTYSRVLRISSENYADRAQTRFRRRRTKRSFVD